MFRRKRLEVLEIGPDDVLIVNVDRILSDEQAARIRAVFNDRGIRSIVKDNSLKITAIKRGVS